MRIAVLSDIHSNIFALEAVLEDINKRAVEQIVNLGDILYGPIAPRATYDCLMRQDIVTIRGNQDRQIYQSSPQEIADNPTLQFILQDLGEEPLEWMKGLPFDIQLNQQVYLCHGTPEDDLIYLLEQTESGHAILRSNSAINNLLGQQKSPVILCGHTHTPRVVQVNNEQVVVNPGSVGLPAYIDDEPWLHAMETGSPAASYAIVEVNGYSCEVEQLKVNYDYRAAAKLAAQNNRQDWFGFLTTGRAALG